MADADRDQSWVAANRLAVAVVVGSLFVLAVIGLLYRVTAIEYLIPAHGPAAESVPLYFMLGVVSVALTVWAWYRLLSLLE